jgi:Zn-dependent protease
MSLETYTVLFQAVAFLFAISVHESAHAWTANRCGDPTARMLGRITLNPLKHIDPIGTIVMPAIAYFTGFPMIGWAKPTPVDPRHFKNPVWDDIKTSLAGPISNLMIATGSVIVLGVISRMGDFGHQIVQIVGTGGVPDSRSPLVPLALLAFQFLIMNIILAAFNVIPIPPLDGSHVLRHFLPENMRRAYDMIGMFGLIILLLAGGRLLGFFAAPLFHFFGYIIAKINA